MAGLEPHFQRRLTEFEIADFGALVEKARVIERAKQYELERHKKRGTAFVRKTYDAPSQSSTPNKKRFFKPLGVKRNEFIKKDQTTCWKCKGAHLGRDCPHLQHKCHHCKEAGHIASECPKATCFVCKKVGHMATSCPQRTNVSAGPSQSKGNNGNPGPSASKNTAPARLYAMCGEPIDMDEYMVDEDDNVWVSTDVEDTGLIAGKRLSFMLLAHTHMLRCFVIEYLLEIKI